jgi:protein-tyrosine phosphatase
MSIVIDNLILSSISEIHNNPEILKNTALHINAAEDVVCRCFIPTVQINLNWYDTPIQDINQNGILFHIIKLMDSYLKSGKQVLVNCFAGVSRSTTIVIAYLMYKNKWNVKEAIDFVRTKRYFINPNHGFICQLHKLQQDLHTLDENYIQLCSNFHNKNNTELAQEISSILTIPFIKELVERDYVGFDMPEQTRNMFISL